jgi:transcription-repair coupling factor (superfamily II helicase)
VNLTGLLSLLEGDPRYHQLVDALRDAVHEPAQNGQLPVLSIGLLEAARPYVIAALQRIWPGPIVLVAARPENGRQAADQIRAWSAEAERVLYYQAPDAIFYERMPWDRSTIHARVSALAALMEAGGAGTAPAEGEAGRGLVITTSVWALITKSVSPLAFRRATRRLQVGDVLPPYQLMEHLVRAGYEPVGVVEEPGTFCHRGSIVDVYPPDRREPVRIDYFGDEIDSMRTFDPGTQRSKDDLKEVTLVPASEALAEWGAPAAESLRALDLDKTDYATRQRMSEEIERLIAGEPFTGIEFYLPYLYPRGSTLLDFLPRNALVLLDDMVALESAALGLENQSLGMRADMVSDRQLPPNVAVPYLTWEELKARLAAKRAVTLGFGAHEGEPLLGESAFVAAPEFGGHVQHALDDIADLRSDGRRVVVITRQAERMCNLLREKNVYCEPTTDLGDVPPTGSVQVVDGIVMEGWVYNAGQVVVLTDAEVFGWSRPRRRRPAQRRSVAPETLFADLKEGDYVVHIEYGIGRYHGMVRKTIGSLEREYLEIEYAAGDRLFVPIHQANRVGRYLGADDREPYMHRLGGGEWAVARARAEKAVRDIAEELLELYAAREVAPGYSFGPDTTWQHELESSFPYEETDDQLRALAEVKADMERPKPMDRLICGDVGYGKTEVALRAAFKAVMAGRQVAVLVPTTVLAQQHYHTFRRRLRAFPVEVAMLSRFLSPSEQDDVIEGLVAGRVDIVIGTHRLLSKDVTFRDLGLLIIDEEQRFGVSHKEQLKQLRREVDVLTLTATPIPRTLYMALSGARDMSIIDTPPEDRLPVRTFVAEWDEGLIRKAILREMDRGGQVYLVHNRVQDIYLVAEELRRIVPEASVVIGHGQMAEDELAQVMLGFAQGEHDVLLCTTIIESGLDIPNVNTIIIDRADTFGLAQLYQLRGRVGRGSNRAYAYLLYKQPLSEIAEKRLQTIQEASDLGAGFRVAMRDMEIRGAGEILGAEQHGHIAAIGFDLYVRLLQHAVEELRRSAGEPVTAIRKAQHAVAASSVLGVGPSIDLPVSAYLPEDFAPDSQLRLRFYRRMARVDTVEDVDELEQEMADRFGELAEPVKGLLYLLRVRVLASDAGIQSVSTDDNQVALALPLPLSVSAGERVSALLLGVRARGTRIWLRIDEGWQENLLSLLRTLKDLVPAAVAA